MRHIRPNQHNGQLKSLHGYGYTIMQDVAKDVGRVRSVGVCE